MVHSLEVFLNICDEINRIGEMVGLSAFQETFPITILVFLLLCDMLSYAAVSFYCFYKFRNDFELFTFCLVTFGYLPQVSVLSLKKK